MSPETPGGHETEEVLSDIERERIETALFLSEGGVQLFTSNIDEKTKEEIKAFQDKQKAGEVQSIEEQRNYLDNIYQSFTRQALEKANSLCKLQEISEELRQKAVSRAKENGTSVDSEWSKLIKEVDIEHAKERVGGIDEEFKSRLLDLKQQLMSDKVEALKEKYEAEGFDENTINEKITSDILKGGVENPAYEMELTRMSMLELEKNHAAKERANKAEKENEPSLIKKAWSKWIAMPKAARIAISSTVGFVAAGATGGVGALGLRMVRGLFGATASGLIQKYVSEKLLDTAEKKSLEKMRSGVIAGGEFALGENSELINLAIMENFALLTEMNLARTQELDEEIREKEKKIKSKYKWARVGTAVATGLLVGFGTGAAINSIFEPSGVDSITTGTSGGNSSVGVPHNSGVSISDADRANIHVANAAHFNAEHPSAAPYDPSQNSAAHFNAEHPSAASNDPSQNNAAHFRAEHDVQPVPVGKVWELTSAKSGDSVWRVIQHDLEKNVPGFKDLNEAQRTLVIDHYKDMVAEDPQKYGLTDVDHIKIGWGAKELQGMFAKDDLDKILGQARGLSTAQISSILESNRIQYEALHSPVEQVEVIAGEAVAGEVAAETLIDEEAIQNNIDLYKASIESSTDGTAGINASGAEYLVRFASENPKYVVLHPELADTLHKIHEGTLNGEFSQDISDTTLLRYSVVELGKLNGLSSHDARIYADYLGQGSRMNHESFGRYIDEESGKLLTAKLEGHMDYFHELSQSQELPQAGVGQSISKWEPRTLYLNEQKPEIYLVRQMGDGFEYRGTNGAVYNTSAVGLKAYMSAPEYADQVNSAIRKPMA